MVSEPRVGAGAVDAGPAPELHPEPVGTRAREGYPEHPSAAIFPRLEGAEFAELVSDIREKGLLNPIVLYDGKILDGRNRLAACQAAGVEPAFSAWFDPGCGPTAWVISQNLKRRHLNASQRAVIALDVLPLFAIEAKGRQGNRTDLNGHIPPVVGESAAHAGHALSVSRQYVEQAKAIAQQAPELIPAIRSGEKTITQAQREIKETRREERREQNRELVKHQDVQEAPITARFATIVMDPPWDWGDEGDADQLGRARPTYGTMSIAQLLAMPVPDWADVDCHLYLWITNRSLPKGFALLERWGFRYITCLTWCKPSFGMGNYFRGSSEQVLFGVKGSQPLKRKDAGTWFLAPRPGRHSAKPPEFADIVESCSPGPYLEVFARSERDGWVSMGAEVPA